MSYRKCGMCEVKIQGHQNSYITNDETILCGDSVCWNDWCRSKKLNDHINGDNNG